MPVRVLVVDDDTATRVGIVRSLLSGEIPLQVEQCSDGIAAMERLRQPFACVFIDHLLPGRNGLSLLRDARTQGISTPIVLLTGAGDESLAVEAMRAGAADYLPKSLLTADSLRTR